MIAYGFFSQVAIQFSSKDFDRAVDQAVAALESLLSENELTSNINFDENREGFVLTIEVPEQLMDHSLVQELDEVMAEIGFFAGAGAVETLYEGEEDVEFYGFPAEVEEMKKFYQPVGAESLVGLVDDERDCYEVMFG